MLAVETTGAQKLYGEMAGEGCGAVVGQNRGLELERSVKRLFFNRCGALCELKLGPVLVSDCASRNLVVVKCQENAGGWKKTKRRRRPSVSNRELGTQVATIAWALSC